MKQSMALVILCSWLLGSIGCDAIGGGTECGVDADEGFSTDTSTDTDGLSCPLNETWSDCMQVPEFECGASGECKDGVLAVAWHMHILNDDGTEEKICDYACTFDCKNGCIKDGKVTALGQNGADLIEQVCNP